MKAVNELYVFLTGLNDSVSVYELSGFGIDSRWSYLNFTYHTRFEQGVS